MQGLQGLYEGSLYGTRTNFSVGKAVTEHGRTPQVYVVLIFGCNLKNKDPNKFNMLSVLKIEQWA